MADLRPSSSSPTLGSLLYAAMGAAAVMMAHQVAGKAARDALFLDQYAATDLPKIVAAAALLSVVIALGSARLLLRHGPRTLLPASLIVSAALHLTESALIGTYRGPVVVFTYFHIVVSGGILLSMFWSAVNESFSPGEAKQSFGRITAAGTAGGVAGGLAAERLATWISVDSLLLLLAALHAIAMVVLVLMRSQTAQPSHHEEEEGAGLVATTRAAVERAPFLKSLAALVFLTTISAGLIDFLFKSGAEATFGAGPELARFFALFYTGTQAVSFLLQTTTTPAALRNLGLGRTVMTLPVALMGGGLTAFFMPAFGALTAARVGDVVLRGSLFRAGYELFFTPIPSHEKRAVKTAIDVACDRIGDAVGAGMIQLMLLLGAAAAVQPLLIIVIVFAALCAWIAARMDKAYLRALEQGLLHRAVELDEPNIADSTTMSVFLKSMPELPSLIDTLQSGVHRPAPLMETSGGSPAGGEGLIIRPDQPAASQPMGHPPGEPGSQPQNPGAEQQLDAAAQPAVADPGPIAAATDGPMRRLQILRSREPERVRIALGPDAPLEPLAVPQVIRLLAWDEVSREARYYLERHCKAIAGQLMDALLDSSQDFAIRRRIPRILTRCPSQLVVEGLQTALSDPRFDVRFQSSRSLESLHRIQPGLRFDHNLLMRTVEKELSVSSTIWDGRRILDSRSDNFDSDDSHMFLDEVLRDRANQSLEHVFSLLAIMLPREPLKVAFRALHNDDRLLRGLGIEYLETALPAQTFRLFQSVIHESSVRATRNPDEVMRDLMNSQQSVVLQLKDLQRIAAMEKQKPESSGGD